MVGWLKKRIKKVSITHYAVRKKENKKEENELKTKSKYETNPAKVNSLKIELEEFHDQKPDALFVRSMLQVELQDEKCSALFHQNTKLKKILKR